MHKPRTANRYHTLLDYFELRRRAERRLARFALLGWNILLYILSFNAIALYRFSEYLDPLNYGAAYIFRLLPSEVILGLGWSAALLLHSLWVVGRRLAVSRSAAIEQTMRQRLQNDEGFLADDPDALFALHATLDDDLRGRNGYAVWSLAFALLNIGVWLFSGMSQFPSYMLWTLFLFMLGAYGLGMGWSFIRRQARERRIRRALEQELRAAPLDNTHRLRLSDDGEIAMDEYPAKRKRAGNT